MRCPLCGGTPVPSDFTEYLVCQRCSEMLTPGELVRRATRRTRRAYCRANFGTNTYPGVIR